MSLHDAANQVQSAGRGEDKVLVHMTPKEVGGLQSLAMAHGGSLTINPQTGLPEAGILSSLLPTLIGFGLAPLTGGLSAALITGAGYTAATGSLKKGILAGLGAYGGAGLAGGLNSMGAAAGTNAGATVGGTGANAAQTAITNYADDAANFAGSGSNAFSANPAFNPAASKSIMFNTPGATPGMTSSQLNQSLLNPQVNFATGMKAPTPITPVDRFAGAANTSAQTSLAPQVRINPTDRIATLEAQGHQFVETNPNAYVTTNVPNVPQTRSLLDDPGFTQYRDAAKLTPRPASPYVQPDRLAQYRGVDFAGGMQHTPTTSTAVDVSGQTISRPYSDYMSQVGQGAKKVYAGGIDGLEALSNAMPKYSITAGIAGPAMTYADEKREEREEEMRRLANKSPGLIRPYEFDYNATNVASEPYSGSAERTYFQPTYTALTPYEAPGPEYGKAAGGLTALAVGGPVERMAAQNAVGANTGYPMANLQTPMYANPTIQNPEATNVVAPSADAGVSAYTGEARFAGGGSPNPTTKNLGGSADPNYTRREAAGGRSGVATPDLKSSSGYTYDYDPNTMQFTQTGGPGAVPTGKDLALGIGAMDMSKRFNEMAITGKPYNFTPSFVSGATPSGTASGGTAQPVMQPAAPAQPFVPNIDIPAYQTPEQQLGLGGFYDMMNQQLGGYGGYGGYAAGGNVGGISHLGDYSDGGRLLKGPGDGVSDSIPASIGNRQPARLADGEFVVPARIVSEIGNGSTEAGARKLYAMMDRVQRARRKTTGKNQVAKNTKAERLLPA